MTMKTEDLQFIIAQILLVDPSSEQPRIHPKRKEMKQGQLIKRIDSLVQDYEQAEIEIDLEPYKEATRTLRKMKDKEAYAALINEVVMSYSPSPKRKIKEKVVTENLLKRVPINPVYTELRNDNDKEKLVELSETIETHEKQLQPNWIESLKKNIWTLKNKEK